MFTLWCCRGNPDGLFDFHLSASHRLPLLPALWSPALSTCERVGVRLGLYILCVGSVFPAGCFEEHVYFCEFFFLPGYVMFWGLFPSAVKYCLYNVGHHWVREFGVAWQFKRSSYLRKMNLHFYFIFFRILCLHLYVFLTEALVLTERSTT